MSETNCQPKLWARRRVGDVVVFKGIDERRHEYTQTHNSFPKVERLVLWGFTRRSHIGGGVVVLDLFKYTVLKQCSGQQRGIIQSKH